MALFDGGPDRAASLVPANVGTYDARMRWLRGASCLVVAALVCTAIGAFTFVSAASAQGSLTVTCVPSSATQCMVRIPLVSNMSVDVVVTLPANDGVSCPGTLRQQPMRPLNQPWRQP